MTKYNEEIHTTEYVDIHLDTLDDLISSLVRAKESILNKNPEAFNITVETNYSTLLISYFRNRTKSELEDYNNHQDRMKKESYRRYLKLKKEFEGN